MVKLILDQVAYTNLIPSSPPQQEDFYIFIESKCHSVSAFHLNTAFTAEHKSKLGLKYLGAELFLNIA